MAFGDGGRLSGPRLAGGQLAENKNIRHALVVMPVSAIKDEACLRSRVAATIMIIIIDRRHARRVEVRISFPSLESREMERSI